MNYESDKAKNDLIDSISWLKTNSTPEAEPLRTALKNGLELFIKKKSDKLLGVKTKTPNKIKNLKRNELITDAAVLLVNDGGYTPFIACGELSYKMKHFRCVTLKNIHKHDFECTTEMDALLKRIFELDINAPVSQPQLYRIVKNLL